MTHLTSRARGPSRAGRPGWVIEFPFDVDTIAELKRAIPRVGPDGVNWEERYVSQTWWVTMDYQHILVHLFPDFATVPEQSRLAL